MGVNFVLECGVCRAGVTWHPRCSLADPGAREPEGQEPGASDSPHTALACSPPLPSPSVSQAGRSARNTERLGVWSTSQ